MKSEQAEKTPLRVLFFEDDTDDIELTRRVLESAQFDVIFDMVVTLDQFTARICSRSYDVILSDYRMPDSTGMDCFAALQEKGVNTPFILVTGSMGDEKAVECLKAGVSDYVLKDRLARLPAAIRRAMEEQRLRTEQAKAQEALRRSEASYRSLIQSAPCGILRLDAADGRLLDVNVALSEMLGYPSPDELLTSSAGDGIALDQETLKQLTQGCEQSGQVGIQVQWKGREKTRLLIELRGRLLRDESGAPACFEMIAENVTERRLAEERIAQLNRLYSVLSHAGQAIVHMRRREELFREISRIMVTEGRFRMAWVGLVQDSNRVLPVASWGDEDGYLDEIHITTALEPEGNGPVGRAIRMREHVVCNDLINDSQMAPWRERAQSRNYGSMGAFPLVLAGEAIGAIAIYAPAPDFFDHENVALLDKLAANVSFALESIAAEEKHQRAVDELNQFFAVSLDLLCIADMNGHIYRHNPAWEKTLGFSDAEISGRPWWEFVHPDDRPKARAATAGFAKGQAVDHLELRFISKDGSYRWLMGSAAPSVGEGIVFAAVSDITEQKHLEEQLRSQYLELEEQNRRVQAASRMKSEFLANMSHELRSPLNGIIGFTELLYDCKLGPIPERPREFLSRIHKSAQHLLQLINGVLDLSKIEAGRFELRREKIQVSNTIQEVAGILSPLAAEKRIRVAIDLSSDVETVITDAGRLKQILYNYLSNALKFTGEGGQITVRLKAEGSTDFRLEVTDTGIGIPDKDIARLFTEFQQLDSTAAKRYQGTGLGLALTKHIVEAQGGRVGVHSRLGEGSTFYAVLPRRGPITSSTPTILVVEGERVESFVISGILKEAGYAVETAETCAAAVAKCRGRLFDAITLDLLLPDGSGYKALSAIRAIKELEKTPVIVISVTDQKERAQAHDIQGFLTRPVDPQELIALLERNGITLERECVA